MATHLIAPSLAALALVLSGCSQSGGISETKLEESVTDQLETSFGQRPDAVDCPGTLKAEVDTTMRCTLTAGEDKLGMTLTVTKVEGKDVKFDIEIDDKPM